MHDAVFFFLSRVEAAGADMAGGLRARDSPQVRSAQLVVPAAARGSRNAPPPRPRRAHQA